MRSLPPTQLGPRQSRAPTLRKRADGIQTGRICCFRDIGAACANISRLPALDGKGRLDARVRLRASGRDAFYARIAGDTTELSPRDGDT